MQQSPVIANLTQITSSRYMAAVRERKQRGEPIKSFLVDEIDEALALNYRELSQQREANVSELKQVSSLSKAINKNFTEKLSQISKELQEAKASSIDLHQSTQEISSDFSKFTDQLDNATSLVARAQEMVVLISFIQEFNKDLPIERLKENLERINFPQDIYEQPEIIAKIMKVVRVPDVLHKDRNQLQKAIDNVEIFQTQLRDEFYKKIEEFNNNPEEQGKCARALAEIQCEDAAIKAVIALNPFNADNPQMNNIKYSEKVLTMPPDTQIERYKYLCEQFYKYCEKEWPNLNTIFGKNMQAAKNQMVQTIWNTVFHPFVANVLDYNKSQRTPEEFCQVLFAFFTSTKEMMKKVWAIDKQIFSSTNFIDMTFSPFQIDYISSENFSLSTKMQEIAIPCINRFKEIIEKQSKLFKSDEKYDIFSEFDPDVPISILKEGAAAWERCIVLAPPNDMFIVLKTLTDIVVQDSFRELITSYLKACELCMEKETNIKVIASYIDVTATCNSAVLTLDEKYNNILKKALSANPAAQEQFVEQKDKLITDFEASIKKGLQICINIIINRLKTLLSSKTFKSQYSAANINVEPSKTCKEICRIIGEQGHPGIKANIEVLSADNKMSFAAVLTAQMWDTITKAYFDVKYEFPVGPLLLQTEASEYKKYFGSFNIKALNRKLEDFEIAVKLMNSPAQNLKDMKTKLTPSQNALYYAKKLLNLRSDAKDEDLVSLI